jgi:hypothetical protein
MTLPEDETPVETEVPAPAHEQPESLDLAEVEAANYRRAHGDHRPIIEE